MLANRLFPIIWLLALHTVCQQSQQTPIAGILQTRRVAFGSSNAMIFNQSQATYALQFERTFSTVPRIGLAVYSMDFQYSPTFSTKVNNGITTTNANLQVSTTNSGKNNQLFLMYMATDHALIGIFMPPALITDQLNLRLPSNTQSFQFNYKEIVSKASQVANIRVSVFLTGISMNSQLTENGYPNNRIYFKMFTTKRQLPFYTITVQVQSMFGDIAISQVEYTIIYFEIQSIASDANNYTNYLMDSGVTLFSQFGGTSTPTSQSNTLPLLPNNSSYQGITIFYGISSLDCSKGGSVAISAYPTTYNNSNRDQFVLNAQTWKLSFISFADYSYVQYMTLKCNLPGANCDNKCQNSTNPRFILNGVCSFCQYSCLTCNISNSASICDSCDNATRMLNTKTKKCDCKSGFFDTYQGSYTCQSCYPCATCTNNNQVCLTCFTSLHMVKNSVLSTCQCVSGFYPNYLKGTQIFNSTVPCLNCTNNCLVCLNSTFCLACDLTTYLFGGACIAVCDSDQLFAFDNKTCVNTSSSLYEQNGRLGFEWSYIANQSALNIILTFSQPSVLFYYYQNQTGYSQGNSQEAQGSAQNTQFYYDDGNTASEGFQNSKSNSGASSSSSALNSQAALSSNAASIKAAMAGSNSSGGSGGLAGSGSIAGFNFNLIRTQDLDGSYLGLSQQYYYYLAYYYYQQKAGIYANYTDQYGIPFGKINISSNTPIKNKNYIDALSNNLVVKIDNDVIPYQITSNSNNTFNLVATVSKSYYGEPASIILKNPGLARADKVASQVVSVTQPIYIYVCGIQSYINSANSLYQNNKLIVGVFWGVGKYPLFLGFGWVFMPLMLTLQYITSLNYVSSQKPLNLDLFLQSFIDFKNPSIFYDPVRKNMDISVVNHRQMYIVLPFFNRFDRGIDFMKNCFQYLLVPFISFLVYILLIGLNKVLNICCKKDIPLISQYIKPRLPLHIASYTLVQAIGVSFFFFAQLNDTKFSSINAPNAIYPIFNVAMAYLSFFLTCNIPLLLLAFIYFTYTNKETKFNTGSQLFVVFTQLMKQLPTTKSKAFLSDPLWTQDSQTPISYGFSGAVFFMPIFYGFFTSFFYNNFAWQLTGLILTTALFGFFAFENDKFISPIIKYFWFFLAIFLLAFLFLLAAIGSNISGVACGQQNLGYLGIGILYALLLLSVIASFYFLWLTIFNLYTYYFKERHFIISLDDNQIEPIQREAERIKSMKERLKSKMIKSSISNNYGQRDAIPSENQINNYNRQRAYNGEQNANTDNRLREEQIQDEIDQAVVVRQKLNYQFIDANTKEYVFASQRTQRQFRFSEEQGKYLYNIPRLYITKDGEIFDSENNFIDRYVNQIQEIPKQALPTTFEPSRKYQELNISKSYPNNPKLRQTENNNLAPVINNPSYQEELKVTNIYNIDGQNYVKDGEDGEGNWIMRNQQTNEIRRMDENNFANESNYQQQASSEHQQNIVQDIKQRQPTIKNIQNQQISGQIQNNTAIFDQRRTINIDGVQYTSIGQENGMIKVFDPRSKMIQRITQEAYARAVIESFNNRINFNGRQFSVQTNQKQQNIVLIDAINPKNRKVVNIEEFKRLKQQNQVAFKNYLQNKSKQTTKQNIFTSRIPEQNMRTTLQQQQKQSYPQQKYAQQSNSQQTYHKQSYHQQSYPQQPYQATSTPNQMLLLQSKATREQKNMIRNEPYNDQYVMIQNQIKIGENTISQYQKYVETTSQPQKYVNNMTATFSPSKQQIEMANYSSNQAKYSPAPVVPQQYTEQEELEEQIDGIEDIIKNSNGPFKMFVFSPDKLQETDDEVSYNQYDSLDRKMIPDGKQVKAYTEQMYEKFPGCVIIMIDISTNEEFRLN